MRIWLILAIPVVIIFIGYNIFEYISPKYFEFSIKEIRDNVEKLLSDAESYELNLLHEEKQLVMSSAIEKGESKEQIAYLKGVFDGEAFRIQHNQKRKECELE